jgi:hypothetical protein
VYLLFLSAEPAGRVWLHRSLSFAIFAIPFVQISISAGSASVLILGRMDPNVCARVLPLHSFAISPHVLGH